jgi:hypothetical protein
LVDFGVRYYIMIGCGSFMVILGYIIACWIGFGLAMNIFRFFIYFQSPTHLYNSYMFDKRTRQSMIDVFKLNKNCTDKVGLYFRTSLVLGMVLPFIPLIQAILEVRMFSTGYVPYKPSRDDTIEQEHD